MSAHVRRGGEGSRRFGRAALALLAGALLVAAVGTPTPAQDGGDPASPDPLDLEALRHEYEELVGDEADLLVRYDQAGARLTELLPQVQAADEAVARADQAVVEAREALDQRRDDESAAEAARVEARRQVAAAEERLRTYAVETYMDEGNAAAMDSALDVLDGNDGSLARRGYRRTVSDQQRDLIHALVTARRQNDAAARRARGAAREAEEQRERVDELRAIATARLADATRLAQEAAGERRNQEVLLVEVRSRKVSIEARITSLQKAADGLAALLAAYQGVEDDWVDGAVDVRIPLAGGTISSEYGMRAHPILNITRLHAGVDIGAPMGAPVLAAANGIVLSSEARGGYGNTVVVAHGSSLSTVYAHNSANTVQVGDVVQQGQVIALVGSTGLSTGPHIHFETRIKGVPVNPRNFLLEGDASYGQEDLDGDGFVNAADPDPEDPDLPVPR